jgi:hypothetical protein
MKVPSHISLEVFKSDWAEGLMIAEMCQRHTLTKDYVVRLRVKLGLPPRLDRSARRRTVSFSMPTPEEIKQRAEEIKRGWDEDTEKRRRGHVDQPYEIPSDVETPEDFDPGWYD